MNVGEVVANITAKMDGLKSGLAEAKSTFSTNLTGMKEATTSINPALAGVDNAIKKFSEDVQKTSSPITSVKETLISFKESLNSSSTSLENIDKKQQLWLADNKNTASALEISNNAINTNKSKMEELDQQITKGKEALENLKTSLGSTSEGYKSTENAVMDLELKYKSLLSETKVLEDENKKLQETENNNSTFMGRLKSSMSEATQSTGELGDKTEEAGAKTHRSLLDSAQSLIMWGTAATGTVMGTYKMVQSASDLNEAQNVVQQVYKTSSQAILDWTATTAKSAGISQTFSTQWSGAMGAMLKSSGVTEQSAGTMSKSLVQLTGDMSSFYNVSNDDMWEKIRSGISGETMPLKELGINMDVANLSAYALSQGIHTAYDKMSQAQQTTLRYNYLMSVTKDAQGDFGRTLSTSFANQVRVAEMNVGSLGRSFGTMLLPAFQSAVTGFNKNIPVIKDAIQGLLNTFKSVFSAIGPIISGAFSFVFQLLKANMPIIKDIGKDLLTIATNVFPSLSSSGKGLGAVLGGTLTTGLKGLKGVLDWLAQHGEVVRLAIVGIGGALVGIKVLGVVSSITKMGSAVSDTIKGFKVLKDAGASTSMIMKVLFGLNPMTLGLVVGIAALAMLAYEVISHWGPISKFFEKLWKDVTSVTSSAWNGIKNFFSGLWNWVDNFFKQWAKIPSYIGGICSSIKSGASSAFNSLKSTISSALNGIKSLFATILTPIVRGVINIFNSLKPGLTTIFNGIKTVISSIWLAIKTVILGPVLLIIDLVTGNFKKLSSDAQGIFNNLKSAFTGIWSGIKEIFTGALQAISGFLQLEWNGIVNIAESAWNNFTNFMSNLWTNIKNTATNAWTSLKSSVINLVTSIVQGAINLWNSLINWFENLPSRLYNLGVSMFTSMKNGISGAISTIGSVITNGFNSAINFLESLPGKALGWGKDFIDGLIKGITGSVGAIGNAVSGIGDKIRSFLHFSVPDEGPLTDYESWMPDFVKGLANGISNSKHLITNAVTGLAGSLKVGMNLTPTLAGGTNLPTIIPDNSSNNPGLSFNIQHLTLNGYKDVKKMMRDAYNIQQDYNKGKGN